MIHWLEYNPDQHDELLVTAALLGEVSPIYMCLRGDISCYEMLCLAADMGIVSKPHASYFLFNPNFGYGYGRDYTGKAKFNVAVRFDIHIPFKFITANVSKGETLSIETEVETSLDTVVVEKHFKNLLEGRPLPDYINREIVSNLMKFLIRPDGANTRWRSNILAPNSASSRRPYRLPSQADVPDIYFTEVALELQ